MYSEVVCTVSLDLSFIENGMHTAQSGLEVCFMRCDGFINPGSLFLGGGGCKDMRL